MYNAEDSKSARLGSDPSDLQSNAFISYGLELERVQTSWYLYPNGFKSTHRFGNSVQIGITFVICCARMAVPKLVKNDIIPLLVVVLVPDFHLESELL